MIEERARDLGRLIGQSAEYQALKRANELLADNKEAVALLREMEQLRVDAQRMIAGGQHPTPDMEERLDTLLSKVQVQGVYQRLIVAQENFDKTMGKVNDWILDGIEKGAASPIIVLG
jgi:cell fate (sporulation/competence/biofilm development) regulator YlbF (YheA/YmcA/DUF963 family)